MIRLQCSRLRRSERLSQKRALPLITNDEDIPKSGTVHKANNLSYLHRKSGKTATVVEDVPLDLTICKSEVFSNETSINPVNTTTTKISSQHIENLANGESEIVAENTIIKEIPSQFFEHIYLTQPSTMLQNYESTPIIVAGSELSTPNPNKAVEIPPTVKEMTLNKVKVESAPKGTQNRRSTKTSSKKRSTTQRCKSQQKQTGLRRTPSFKQRTRAQNSTAMDFMQGSSQALWKYTNTQLPNTSTMLPNVYPSHFKYQLPPEAVLKMPLVTHQPDIMTPELTESFERRSYSTSPSIPESLLAGMERNELKELLDVEHKTYLLHDCHVYALATTLNMRQENLKKILDRIVAIDPGVLRRTIETLKKPFQEDRDLFPKLPTVDSEKLSGSVRHSQSPKMSRFFYAKYKNKSS